MSNDILSKAFTTTRRLELEYRKIPLFREPLLVFETSTRRDEASKPSIATGPTVLADVCGR
jgi:hypothetical protein